jgi:hypothetical protein
MEELFLNQTVNCFGLAIWLRPSGKALHQTAQGTDCSTIV